jgi:hypothetical protein
MAWQALGDERKVGGGFDRRSKDEVAAVQPAAGEMKGRE